MSGVEGATDDVPPDGEPAEESPGLLSRAAGAIKESVPKANKKNAFRVGMTALGGVVGAVGGPAGSAVGASAGSAAGVAAGAGLGATAGQMYTSMGKGIKRVKENGLSLSKRQGMAIAGAVIGGTAISGPGAYVGALAGYAAKDTVEETRSKLGEIKDGWRNPGGRDEVERDGVEVERGRGQEIEGRGQDPERSPDRSPTDRRPDEPSRAAGTDEGLDDLFPGGDDDSPEETQGPEAQSADSDRRSGADDPDNEWTESSGWDSPVEESTVEPDASEWAPESNPWHDGSEQSTVEPEERDDLVDAEPTLNVKEDDVKISTAAKRTVEEEDLGENGPSKSQDQSWP